MIHLAALGFTYNGTRNEQGRRLATGPEVKTPRETLCGASVARLGGRMKEVLLPHDHRDACRECLRALPQKRDTFDYVQPIIVTAA